MSKKCELQYQNINSYPNGTIQNDQPNLERLRTFSYDTTTKLSRLSHEELMIPLIYWTHPPKHHITAMYIQKSMRSGDIIFTGSKNGEFVIWKPYQTVHEYKHHNHHHQNNQMGDIDHWIPIAMTLSTNNSPIVSILASFQHKEQAAFLGIYPCTNSMFPHDDGYVHKQQHQ